METRIAQRFFYLLLTIISSPLILSGQATISGIINDYSQVTAIDQCSNSVTVNNVGGLSVGDRVLLIQMKGANIDVSNSSSFGTVMNYNNAGNYEFATIQAISGNQITFQNFILRSYTPSQSVQLIRVPTFTNVSLSGNVTAQPWNGATGGIVVFAATGNVNLNGNTINVSGQGFQGGTVANVSGPCSSTDYFYDCNSQNGANKGESIVDLACAFQRGLGPAAGGAGGANGHNNGGGGGANGAPGGQGGCFSGCCNGGKGGNALSYSNALNKTFFGSGGGAGHANDNANVPGANGGGIVMISANTINGANGSINADGNDANSTGVDDGVGGGGAGGTVMLNANSYSGSLTVTTNGGNGGNNSNSNPHGPGGGGGGGVLWVSNTSLPAQINYVSNGGANGTYQGNPRSAQSGQTGVTRTNLQIPAGTNPFAPLAVNTTEQDINCNGAANGWVSANVSGGATPYSFSWSNNLSTDSIADLSPGTYSVTVTDNNNCTVSASATITEPPPLTSTISSKNDVSCFGGNDGSATVTANGGVTPYSYSWNTSPPQNTPTANNLSAGNYTITVTDDSSCTTTDQVTINQPPTVTITTTTSDVTCNGGNDGWVSVSINGGTPPYTFNWSNGASTDSTGGLNAGAYTVTITDNSGCTFTATDSLQEPPAIQLSTSVNNVNCNGNSDGRIDLTVNGGTPPYQYNWSNNSSSPDLIGVGAGIYTVTVTDGNGCTSSITDTVQEPTPLSLSTTVEDVTCFNGSDGKIKVSASGGTSPYNFSWSHGPTGDSLANLTAGSYIVIVTDSNNCSLTQTITVQQPPDIALTANGQDPSCSNTQDGSIDLSASGGSGNLTYQWSTGDSAQDINSLAPGNYRVTVTDANNCKDSVTTQLSAPDSLTLQSNTENITCHDGNDGRILVDASGGTPPYSYAWSNGDTTPTLNSLPAGNYNLTLTDDQGCSFINSFSLSQPPQLTVNVQDTFQVEFGQTKQIQATASESDVNYMWSPTDSLSCMNCPDPVTSTVNDQRYTVQVTNQDGCVAMDSTTIFVGPKNVFVPNAFTPNGDGVNDQFKVFATGVKQFRLKIYNRWGEKIFETRNIDQGWDGTRDGTVLPAGVYIYQVHIKHLDNSSITNQSGSLTLIR